jgi:L-lysine 2,3-aminomutase
VAIGARTRGFPVSEAETPNLLSTGHRVTAEDIRALAGASTPHFALQVRNRIRRLIEPLDADDPARREGERKIAELEELAEHSGDPRGTMGISHR